MSQTGLSEFDATVHKTNKWLKDVEVHLDCPDRHRAYHALRVVLHSLRDHLPMEQVIALGAQLPMLIRGFYYEGWRPNGKPRRERRREEFLDHITEQLAGSSIASEEVVRGILHVLNMHLSGGQIEAVKQCLPKELRSLWPTQGQTAFETFSDLS
jgi:uncharacterized protein (DUF2267 family)